MSAHERFLSAYIGQHSNLRYYVCGRSCFRGRDCAGVAVTFCAGGRALPWLVPLWEPASAIVYRHFFWSSTSVKTASTAPSRLAEPGPFLIRGGLASGLEPLTCSSPRS